MKLIDIHTHIYPPAIAKKAAASVRDFYRIRTDILDGTAQTLLKRETEAGVDRFVILPVAIHPDKTRHINDFILEEVAAQPKFIGFGTVHAGMKNIGDEVEFKDGGIVKTRAQEVLNNATELLENMEKEGLFTALEKGIFGGVKRPKNGGKGLEGVCEKGANYLNPFVKLMLERK